MFMLGIYILWSNKENKNGKVKYLVWHVEKIGVSLELVSKELNHLAAILHVYARGLNFMK